MAVNVIDTIKPKNQGTFPVVEAVDVKVTDDKRLDAALNEKASTADLAELTEIVNGKAEQTDLEELSDDLAGKASTDDLASATANLQGQIDQIEISATAEAVVAPEVAAARVDSEGTEFNTLKAHLDASETEFRGGISQLDQFTRLIWNEGYISNDGTIKAGTGRKYSDPIPCCENVSIEYKGETDHARVSALTCYSADDVALLTQVNIGNSDIAYTITTPADTAYIRLSKKSTQQDYLFNRSSSFLNDSIISSAKNIDVLNKDAAVINNYVSKLIRASNIGVQDSSIPYSWTNGLVHNRNYYNPAASTYTVYSDLKDNYGPIIVSPGTGYKAAVVSFGADYDGVSYTLFKTSEFEFTPETPYYCLELRAVDESNIPAADIPASALTVTQKIGAAIGEEKAVCFVQTTGSDDNDGLSRSTPFATIQKAVDSGYKTILVQEGVYNSGVSITDKTGITIMLDHNYDDFTAGSDEDNPKIIINGASESLNDGFIMIRCTDCTIKNIEVKNVNNRGFVITRCSGLQVTDCIAHDCGVGATSGNVGGFVITYTDADFDNCIAYNIGTNTAGQGGAHFDGFNIHYTGTTNFYNCSAWNCVDDGISHHDACCGSIEGGEWYNCGKGGVASPTHGAKINVSNVYCHNNRYGLYAGNTNAVTDRGNILVSNSVFVDNTAHDIKIDDYYTVIAINCIYDTIDGTVTRYGGNIE